MPDDAIELTIDGIKVSGGIDDTVLQVAMRHGIYIPALCYHEALDNEGRCRLCLVEIKGFRDYTTACTTKVAEGMEVLTKTPDIENIRRITIELLLADHPADCSACARNLPCQLHQVAARLAVDSVRYPRLAEPLTVDQRNPFFVRDPNQCILCGRCVAVCHQVQKIGAVDFTGRGYDAQISAAFDKSLEETSCAFCGNCIQVCPTGALMERRLAEVEPEGEFDRVKTICPYCGCGCGLELYVREGQVARVMGDEDNEINRGWLCVKGRFGYEFITSPDRLKQPLLRPGPRLEPAGWDEALDQVARRLTEIKAQYGPDAIACLSSAKSTNEENYLVQKFARVVIGTNNVDHCARLCHASTVAGLAQAFGSGAMTNSIAELRGADAILVIGSNTTETHPIVALAIKAVVDDREACLIVCDPRQIELCDFAAHWLRQRPGTDVALINGLLHVIINEGLADRQFIAAHTEGFDEMAAVVEDYPPERAAEITGVPADDIRAAARAFAAAERAAIVYAMGITQHTTGTDNVLALANLAMATGNVGRESTGVNPLRGQNNVQGACDMGALPGDFPGYQKLADPATREKFAASWGVPLSDRPGLTLVEMMHAAHDGRIKAMLIMGENPALTDPNAAEVREALARLEFLCVLDLFQTETTEHADVILSAVSFAEKSGTWTNTERRVQLLHPVLPPIGDARADWQIISDLAARMGQSWSYASPSDIFDEMAALTPQYAGMSHGRLASGGLQWPCPTPDHPGTRYLHRDRFTRGLGKFHPVAFRPPAEQPDNEYPFVLTTGRSLYQFHSGTMTRRSKSIEKRKGRATVEINPADAAALGIADGDRVRLTSRRGRVDVPAEVTDRTPPGVVFMPFHYREAAANLLTNDALDPVAKIPELKVCAVRVERIGAAETAAPTPAS
ncbi:formate dehydrogenase [candidate division KD3-62 bacterium DG_56]|uniref:Formate dehydrogenase n=1 Tax=candidate division KD3-62 bacterium DG_56 TaxID=1704032 RepID=A0A0S7XNR4_9BACT|nr:MAG: formate dehydrogenase [candidate division KD3-62 bacterium DG_56]